MRARALPLIVCLLGLTPACVLAQSALPDPAIPGSGYKIPDAVAQGLPRSADCGQAVATLKDNAMLRVSRHGNGSDTITLRNALLDTAAAAAASGDEAGCAYWLHRYRQIP